MSTSGKQHRPPASQQSVVKTPTATTTTTTTTTTKKDASVSKPNCGSLLTERSNCLKKFIMELDRWKSDILTAQWPGECELMMELDDMIVSAYASLSVAGSIVAEWFEQLEPFRDQIQRGDMSFLKSCQSPQAPFVTSLLAKKWFDSTLPPGASSPKFIQTRKEELVKWVKYLCALAQQYHQLHVQVKAEEERQRCCVRKGDSRVRLVPIQVTEHQREDALQQFVVGLDQLLQDMSKRWPKCESTARLTNYIKIAYMIKSTSRLAIEEWHEALHRFYGAIRDKDLDELKKIDHDVFAELRIPQKYEDPKLDAEFRDSLFPRLNYLCHLAKLYHGLADETPAEVAKTHHHHHRHQKHQESTQPLGQIGQYFIQGLLTLAQRMITLWPHCQKTKEFLQGLQQITVQDTDVCNLMIQEWNQHFKPYAMDIKEMKLESLAKVQHPMVSALNLVEKLKDTTLDDKNREYIFSDLSGLCELSKVHCAVPTGIMGKLQPLLARQLQAMQTGQPSDLTPEEIAQGSLDNMTMEDALELMQTLPQMISDLGGEETLMKNMEEFNPQMASYIQNMGILTAIQNGTIPGADGDEAC